MLREARTFAAWHPNVVVKVPSTPSGWGAVSQLKREGIRTNVTLCFTANQALFAALAGAYIATVPFKVLEATARHPLTDKGIDLFLKDWQSFQSQEVRERAEVLTEASYVRG